MFFEITEKFYNWKACVVCHPLLWTVAIVWKHLREREMKRGARERVSQQKIKQRERERSTHKEIK